MTEHEIAEKLKEKIKNKQASKETFEELVEWCSSNLDKIDLSNPEQLYIYTHAANYLMKQDQVLEWDEKDAKVIITFLAKNALINFKLDDKTRVEILSREEFESRGHSEASGAVCVNNGNNTYSIEYSPNVVDSLLSRDTGKILRGFQTIFHEVVHALQNSTMQKEEVKGAEVYLMAMESLARKQSPEIYAANYAHLLKENHAEKLGLKLSMDYMQIMGPELYRLYNKDKIQEMMQKYDSNFYEGKINLYGTRRKSTAQIDKACSQYIAMHPEVLKKFPVLQMGFNLDGTKKDLLQLLAERQQFIDEGKPIDAVNSTYKTVMNYKNFVKGTPGGTKEEILTLCEYARENGIEDEFVYDLMQYRLENTTMEPTQIEEFIQREKRLAAKTRQEKDAMELQHEKEESIKDEVGDASEQKIQSQKQDEKQAETIWMNRLQANNDNVAKMQDGAKKQQDVVKLIQDLDREHNEDRHQEIQEPNEGQGR